MCYNEEQKVFGILITERECKMDGQFEYQSSYTHYEQEANPQADKYATAALILGIIALVTGCCCCCCCIFAVGGACGVAAIVLALLARHSNNGKMPGKAIAGLILGIIAILLCILFLVIWIINLASPIDTPEGMQEYLDRLEQIYGDMGFDVDFDEYNTSNLPQ